MSCLLYQLSLHETSLSLVWTHLVCCSRAISLRDVRFDYYQQKFTWSFHSSKTHEPLSSSRKTTVRQIFFEHIWVNKRCLITARKQVLYVATTPTNWLDDDTVAQKTCSVNMGCCWVAMALNPPIGCHGVSAWNLDLPTCLSFHIKTPPPSNSKVHGLIVALCNLITSYIFGYIYIYIFLQMLHDKMCMKKNGINRNWRYRTQKSDMEFLKSSIERDIISFIDIHIPFASQIIIIKRVVIKLSNV